MEELVLKLIPEINLIKNDDLKSKTIKIWEKAIKENGWTEDDLMKMPFTLLIENTDLNIIDHTRSVTQTAIKIGEALRDFHGERLKIDFDILTSGAILHDVGKLYEYKKVDGKFVKSELGAIVRHPISGAAIAYGEGMPFEIVHTIASHSKEGDAAKRSVEAIIIHHADFLNYEPFKLWG